MTRVATLDIGTNSVLLLVAEHRDDRGVVSLCDRCTITRLGKGVDKTRALDPSAVERTLACLRDYAAIIDELGVDIRAAVATSAVRDASGASAFLDAAQRILGVRPRVIDGPTEARMTFSGALAGLGLDGLVSVFDIGGGSTEIVRGFTGQERSAIEGDAISLDVGAVRMTERHVHADPPHASELDAIRRDVRTALASVARPDRSCAWVGIAGTVTTLCAMELGLAEYDGARVHGAVLTREAVDQWVKRLGSATLAERRRIVGLESARADVIVAGALIVQELLSWAGASQATVSDRGVRWGLALECFGTR